MRTAEHNHAFMKRLLAGLAAHLLVFAIVGGALYVKEARADRVYAGGWSRHWGSDYDYNSVHKLVAYEHDAGWMAGGYNNSFGDDTVFFVGVSRYNLSTNVDFILLGGLNYGYRKCFGHDPESDKQVCADGGFGFQYTKYIVEPATVFKGNAAMLTFSLDF